MKIRLEPVGVAHESHRLILKGLERRMKAKTPSLKPLLVNADQACQMLSMGKTFFYQLLSTGSIPQPIRRGKKWVRWPVATLEKWVSENQN